jgi:cell division protein ZapA
LSDSPSTVDVTLLDRIYKIACPEEDHEALRDAAAYLDRKMRAIRDGARQNNNERIAVMAALDIAFEMLNPDSAEAIDRVGLRRKIASMQSVLDEALAPQAGLF